VIRAQLFILFSIGIYTTFHSALRTFVTPLLVGVGCLHVVYNPIRKRDEENTNEEDSVPLGSSVDYFEQGGSNRLL